MITQERLKELFDYRDDGQLVWRKTLGAKGVKGSVAGTLQSNGYVTIGIDKKIHRAHRLVFMWHKGYLPEKIDHIDCIKTNNKIENLREVTDQGNSANKKKFSHCTSIYKGVTWDNGKWKAQIKVNNKSKHLLRTDNELKAYEAYCKAAKEHFGEFARFA